MWNEECTEKVQDVSPVQNRCIIFNTTSKSFHGHPRPLKTPRVYIDGLSLYIILLKMLLREKKNIKQHNGETYDIIIKSLINLT